MNSSHVPELHDFPVPASHATSRRDHVKRVFEDVPHYLSSRRVDIRFRQDTARAFAASFTWSHLLDVGCGDGSVSLPLLHKGTRLTWMDLSSSMLARAKAQVPGHLAGSVRIRNEDFMLANFGGDQFDLIVSVGVLAHVESPEAFLAKLRSLLRPGGHLILEFTDAFHLSGRIGRLWGAMKECFAPAQYTTNKVSFMKLKPVLDRQGLRLVSTFRYTRIPLPGADRFLDEYRHHRLCKAVFGEAFHNKHASWGNEYICLLTAK